MGTYKLSFCWWTIIAGTDTQTLAVKKNCDLSGGGDAKTLKFSLALFLALVLTLTPFHYLILLHGCSLKILCFEMPDTYLRLTKQQSYLICYLMLCMLHVFIRNVDKHLILCHEQMFH